MISVHCVPRPPAARAGGSVSPVGPRPPLAHSLQEHMCPSGDPLSPEAEYFEAVKQSIGHHFDSLASPDDLIAFFGSLAEAAITACTSAPSPDGTWQGADVNSAMGLQLRMAYARYTAMPFEASACAVGGGVVMLVCACGWLGVGRVGDGVWVCLCTWVGDPCGMCMSVQARQPRCFCGWQARQGEAPPWVPWVSRPAAPHPVWGWRPRPRCGAVVQRPTARMAAGQSFALPTPSCPPTLATSALPGPAGAVPAAHRGAPVL